MQSQTMKKISSGRRVFIAIALNLSVMTYSCGHTDKSTGPQEKTATSDNSDQSEFDFSKTTLRSTPTPTPNAALHCHKPMETKCYTNLPHQECEAMITAGGGTC